MCACFVPPGSALIETKWVALSLSLSLLPSLSRTREFSFIHSFALTHSLALSLTHSHSLSIYLFPSLSFYLSLGERTCAHARYANVRAQIRVSARAHMASYVRARVRACVHMHPPVSTFCAQCPTCRHAGSAWLWIDHAHACAHAGLGSRASGLRRLSCFHAVHVPACRSALLMTCVR